MSASPTRYTTSPSTEHHNSPVLGKTIDDAEKKRTKRLRKSKKSTLRCEGSPSSTKKRSSELDEYCNIKMNMDQLRTTKSRKQWERCTLGQNGSLTSSTNSVSCASTSAETTTSSSSIRSRRSAVSLTNRYEMAMIVDCIRTQREDIEKNGCAAAIKIKLAAYFEEQRRAILLKWKAMNMGRRSRCCMAA